MCVQTYFIVMERKGHLESAFARVQKDAQHIADSHQRVIQDTGRLVNLIALRENLLEFAGSDRCPRFLDELIKREPRVASIVIAASDGSILCSGIPIVGSATIADRVHFKAALSAPGTVVGDLVVSRSANKWILPFAEANRDGSGRVQSVLAVGLDLQWLARELGQGDYPPDSTLGLIDNKGRILARYPDAEGFIGTSQAETPLFNVIVTRGGRGVVEEIGFDNVRRVFAFAHFADTAAGPIYLWLGMSKQSIMGSSDRELAWVGGVALVLLALSLGMVWIGGDRLLLRPLLVIADAARRLGDGEFSTRTGLQYTGDEIGQLARSIDEMAVALSSKSEILKANRALKMLSDCNLVLARAASQQALLDGTCRSIIDIGGYRMAWIGFAEQDAEKTVRVVARYGNDDGYLDTIDATWADAERGHGPTGTAIRSGMTQVNRDFAQNPLLAPWRTEALKRGYRSSVAVPLRAAETVLGALTVYSDEIEAFGDDETVLLEKLAANIALGITVQHMHAEREHAQQALALSESRFRALIRNALDILAVVDAQGTIRFMSPSVNRLGGYEPDDLLGKNYLDFVHPDDAPAAATGLEQLIIHPELPHRAQLRFRDRSGTWVPLESIASNALADPGLGGIVINARDITERMKLEQEREQYFRFFKLSINPMCIADPLGCFKQVNPALVELTGYSEDELLSRPFLDFVHPEDRGRTVEEMERQLSERPSLHFDNRYVRKDGGIIELSWFGYFDADTGVTYATALDITERKRTMELMQRQLDELRRWQGVMLEREGRVTELKKRINELHRKLGGPIPYPGVEAS